MTANDGEWGWPSVGSDEHPGYGQADWGGYGQGPYPPPGYDPGGSYPSQPPYQYGPWYGGPPPGWGRPRRSGEAVAALVLAILSFVLVPIVPAVIALVLASAARNRIWASGGTLRGFGLARLATVLAVINLVVSVFAIAIASGHI